MNLDAYFTCVWLGGHASALAGDRTGAGEWKPHTLSTRPCSESSAQQKPPFCPPPQGLPAACARASLQPSISGRSAFARFTSLHLSRLLCASLAHPPPVMSTTHYSLADAVDSPLAADATSRELSTPDDQHEQLPSASQAAESAIHSADSVAVCKSDESLLAGDHSGVTTQALLDSDDAWWAPNPLGRARESSIDIDRRETTDKDKDERADPELLCALSQSPSEFSAPKTDASLFVDGNEGCENGAASTVGSVDRYLRPIDRSSWASQCNVKTRLVTWSSERNVSKAASSDRCFDGVQISCSAGHLHRDALAATGSCNPGKIRRCCSDRATSMVSKETQNSVRN